MKNAFLSLLATISVVITINAQVPEGIKYQAVARNANGEVMANQEVTLEIIIDKGQSPAQEVFSETHNVETNEFGLVNLVIGSKNSSGLAAIDWLAGEYFISVKLNGNLMGTSQVLSVPYALQAKAAETYNETDPIFTGWDKDYNDLTNKPAIPAIPGAATTSTNGLMSSADKTKLDGVASGAEVNVQANWSQATTTADDYIKNKPGNATVTTSGLMSATDKTILEGIGNIQAKSGTISLGSAQKLFNIGLDETWLVTASVPYSAPANDTREGLWVVFCRSNLYNATPSENISTFTITATNITLTIYDDEIRLNVSTGNGATQAKWSAVRIK